MPTVDTAAAVEQLLKRFEALRSGGTVKVLAVDTAADAMLSEELPPAYREFSNCGRLLGTRYGKPRGDRHPAMCFRLLGDPADIRRFISAAEAAGRLLKGRLSQAHLVRAKEVQGANGKAEQAAWLMSLFSAAARRHLLTDGLAGGDWFLWHKEKNIVVAEQTVERYRQPRPATAPTLAIAEDLSRKGANVTAFAVIDDVAETSIALLRWLEDCAEGSEGAAMPDGQRKTACQLLEELHHTEGGLGQIEEAWGRGGQKAIALLIGRRSAGTVNRSNYFQEDLLPILERLKAARAMQRDNVSRFREESDGSIQ